MTFPELGRRVAVELQRGCQGRLGVRSERTLSRCRRSRLCDAPHADRVVVPPGEQGLTSRSTKGCGMEPGVLQTTASQALCGRGLAGATKGARRSESNVVQQDDQHVRGALWREQRLDGRK